MKLNDAYQLKSVLSFVVGLMVWFPWKISIRRVVEADCKYTTLTTSTAVTKAPKLKVMTRIIFCFLGRRIPVNIGIGRNRSAKSVIRFRGVEDRYIVIMSVQCE